jgi:hypothetical protein
MCYFVAGTMICMDLLARRRFGRRAMSWRRRREWVGVGLCLTSREERYGGDEVNTATEDLHLMIRRSEYNQDAPPRHAR